MRGDNAKANHCKTRQHCLALLVNQQKQLRKSLKKAVLLTDVVDEKKLEAYLDSLPIDRIESTSKVISLRSALAVLPMVVDENLNRHVDDVFRKLLLTTLRCVAVSRVAITDSTNEYKQYAAAAAIVQAANSATISFAAGSVFSVASLSAAAAADHSVVSTAAAAVDYAIDSAAANSSGATSFAEGTGKYRAKVWRSIQLDLIYLLGSSPNSVLKSPLWWASDKAWQSQVENFHQALIRMADDDPTIEGAPWLVWWDWYQPQINGGIPWSLPLPTSEAIEMRIALGDNREDFWEREPNVITQEIDGWVREARAAASTFKPQVFISYNENDRETAKLVSAVIEQETDFRSFAQFKDMPLGSNFISEMQKGLENMALFSPLYSPEYVKSKMCEAEWNAAFFADPTGEGRNFRAFLLDAKTELKPLHKPIVYVPLYELSEDKMREAIRDSFKPQGYKRTAEQSRQDAKNSTTSIPIINAQGLLDSQIPAEETPVLTDEIASLPKTLRNMLQDLIKGLEQTPSNYPLFLKTKLQFYLDELVENGARPNVPDLKNAVSIIAAIISEGKAEDASWLSKGIGPALNQFIDAHQKFIQHFPLRMLDDLKVEQSPINHDNIKDPILIAAHKAVVEAAKALELDGLSTVRPGKLLAAREELRRDLDSVSDEGANRQKPLIHQPGKITKEEIEKRWLWGASGYFDRLLDTVEKATSIADSESGKALVKAVKTVLDKIWN